MGSGLIWAIVLAAGASSRMGFNKLRHELAGTPIIHRVVDTCTASAVDRTVVVLGCRPEELAILLADRDVDLVDNRAWERGMLSSFQCGVEYVLSNDALPEAFLLVLGDAPLVEARTIDALVAGWIGSNAPLAVPVHEGRRGHPLLVAGILASEVLNLGEGETMRTILHRRADEVLEVEAPPGVLTDVDVPGDLDSAERKLCGN